VSPSEILIGALVSLAALVASSYIVEMLRPAPKRPEKLAWAPGIPIQYVDIGGVKVRYIKTGTGANLVLLHTLRTQLDVFAHPRRYDRDRRQWQPLSVTRSVTRIM
jgi:hypothetical protein